MSTSTPDRRTVLALALSADVDVRTAARALSEGVEAIRGVRIRERLLVGAQSAGIALPSPDSENAR